MEEKNQVHKYITICVCILLLLFTNILHYYVALVMDNHYNEEKEKLINHYLENYSFEQKS